MSPYGQVIKLIQDNDNILIVSHHSPDPDTIGAGGALLFYIEKYFPGKTTLLANTNPFPHDLYFLGVQKYSSALANIDLNNFNLIIMVDCGDINRTGISENLMTIKGEIPTVNIDHHPENPGFADLNIVETISSTAEIILKIFKENKIKLTKKISTCLLAGITYDTAYFTNSATTKEAMAAASELMNTAADIRSIIRHTWENKNKDTLKLWGEVLEQLHFNKKYQIAVAIIPKHMDINHDLFNDLKNHYLQYLYEAKFIIIMIETKDGWIHCSLRTNKDNVDVSKLARLFGGGGHKKSAGFSIQGTLEKNPLSWVLK